jgi:hypothetical protein
MSSGHWSRLRSKGMGPRGGGGGHTRGPLRKIIRHRKLYTVTVLPCGRPDHWKNWEQLLETEVEDDARRLRREHLDSPLYREVRLTESGWREVLECGHDQPPVCDLIGETNAVRRRCRKCRDGKPPDCNPSL